MKPRWTDWLLVGVSGAFVAAGILILVTGKDVRGAVATIAFFGTCLGIAIWGVRQRLAGGRNATASSVSVAGSVPIRMKRGRLALMGLGLVALSTILLWAHINPSPVYLGAIVLMGIAGLAVLILVAAGRGRDDYLVFEPGGLRIGRPQWQVLVPWDSLKDVSLGEIQRNPVVLILLADPDAVAATALGSDPERARKALQKRFEQDAVWTGAHLALHPFRYGLDAALLAKALARYASDPGSRVELRPRPALPEVASLPGSS
ncbi:MAG: hypothetical protein U0166_24270 [Acidobacteriota bacterium]